jgi:hypothetical protein
LKKEVEDVKVLLVVALARDPRLFEQVLDHFGA